MIEGSIHSREIGKVVSASADGCEVSFAKDSSPKLGEWVSVGMQKGFIESFRYRQDGSLHGKVKIISQNVFQGTLTKPKTAVCYLDPDFLTRHSEEGIIAGYVNAGREIIPVHLKPEFLLGPEGAHMNATGISGLATKTSFIMSLLLRATEHALRASLGLTSFVVNLKFQDLMGIHEELRLSDRDCEVYRELGIECKAFPKVKYFAPRGSQASGRRDCETFGYSIKTGMKCLRHLVWDLEDSHRTLCALIESLNDAKEHEPAEFGPYKEWDALWTEPPLAVLGPNSWGDFPVQTVRRFTRHMHHVIGHMNTGLFVDSANSDFPTIKDIVEGARAGETIVLDFSSLNNTEQFFCMSELVQSIHERA